MMKFASIPSGRREVRRFGLLFAVIGLLLTLWLLSKSSGAWVWSAGGGLFFLLSGLLAYPLLKPIYLGWMAFAYVLGWVNTRLLLGVFFYLVISPVGLIMRLLGRDPMLRKFDKSAVSYWVKKEVQGQPKGRYENLF